MIAQITGIISLITKDGLIILTPAGIGYFASVPLSVLSSAKQGEQINLYSEMIVKEDSHSLFAFADYEELLWFRALIKVSGVGAKTALNVISHLGTAQITSGIQEGGEALFASVSGLGKKTATRIVSELNKEPHKIHIAMQAIASENPSAQTTYSHYAKQEDTPIKAAKAKEGEVKPKSKAAKPSKIEPQPANKRLIISDISLALEALGYDKLLAFSVASKVSKESHDNQTTEELIKTALKIASGGL
jgi:Holliday junction DNA helicase RuvA